MYAMGRTESSGCFCSCAAPKPSKHASQYTCQVEPSATASLSGKTKIGRKLGENFAHDNLYGGRELKLDYLPEEGGDRADPLEQVSPHGLDVSRWVGVEENHIVEVGRHLFQAIDNLVDILDEPPG